MANSIHVLRADEVVVELNAAARSWTGLFTATRKWLPVYKTTDLESLKVAVVPMTIETTLLARPGTKKEYDFTIAIDFQKQLNINASGFDAAVDVLDSMVQDVADFFQDGHELAAGYRIHLAVREDVHNMALLYAKGTWEALIVLQVKGLR
jgi:hypothetical protein